MEKVVRFITVLALVLLVSLQALAQKKTEKGVIPVNSIVKSKYIQIRAIPKPANNDEYIINIDYGTINEDPIYLVKGIKLLTEEGEIIHFKSPMQILNFFYDHGYEFKMQTAIKISSSTSIFYLMERKDD
jgi:hypothetical protein